MDDKIVLKGVKSEGYGIIPKLAMKDRDLDVVAKAFYSYLCSYAGAGNTAFPSIEKICYDLNISEKRLQRHRKDLVNKGYISIKRVNNGGVWTSNIYTIEDVLKPVSEQNVTVQNVPVQNVTVQNRGTNNNSTNNNSTNNNSTNIKDMSTSSPAVQDKYENDINEIVNHLNLSTGVKNRPQTKSTVKLLTKILKEGYTVDNCKDVINFKTHEWINNAKMRGNLVPGTLFAFANFEKYMDQLMLANQPVNNQKKYQAPTQQAPSKEVIKLEPDHNGFDGTNLSYEFMNRGIDNDTLIAYYKKQVEITGKGVFDGNREVPLKEWIGDFQAFNTKSITQN